MIANMSQQLKEDINVLKENKNEEINDSLKNVIAINKAEHQDKLLICPLRIDSSQQVINNISFSALKWISNF